MAINLLANIFSIKAQRALGNSTDAVQRSLERLASGSRINRSSDDAAGLAVVTALNVKSRTLDRAALNVSDGLSAVGIIEGALDAVGTLFARMSELAAQAASGSLSSGQRGLLDQEYQQLNAEIHRISKSSAFNGINFLDGGAGATRARENHGVAGGIRAGDLSADGRFVAYTRGDGALVQLDFVTGEETLITADGVAEVVSSASGQTVAFLPGSGNKAYVWDKNTGSITEVANVEAVGGILSTIGISADGSTVAFLTDVTIDQSGEAIIAGGSNRITSVRIAEGLTTQIVADSGGFKLSADGSLIGFISSSDPTGENPGSDIRVFLAQTNDASQVDQIGNYENAGSVLGFAGNRLLIDSIDGIAAVEWGDNNASVLYEGQTGSSAYRVSTDGLTLSFFSASDPLGENSDLVGQIFRFDLLTGTLEQSTRYTSGNDVLQGTTPVLSGDGLSAIYTLSGTLFRYDFSPDDYQFSISTGSGTAGAIQTSLESLRGALQGLGSQLLTTESAARGALDHARANIENLAAFRGQLGAAASRFNTAYSLINTVSNESKAAASRVSDVDVASEAANLTRSQIVQQVGTAILAQANLQPNLVLNLLNSQG